MAGRGTDIILGGSPEGLTQLGLMRLLYRRLMKVSECVQGAWGCVEAMVHSQDSAQYLRCVIQ